MRRGDGLLLCIALGLALYGGFVYLGHHPESPWLEKAQEWPYVGELARRFREAYLPRTSAGVEASSEEAVRVVVVEMVPTEPIDLTSMPIAPRAPRKGEGKAGVTPPPPRAGPLHLPPPSAVETRSSVSRTAVRTPITRPALPQPELRYIALDWVWYLPGNRILAAAQPEAEVQLLLESMSYLPVLAREGNWAQVFYNDRKGWIDTSWKPPFKRRKAGRGILRHRAEPVKSSYFFNLKKARRILGIGRTAVKVGAYDLYTDVEDETLLAFLDSTAAAAEEAYFARYGRLPEGNPTRSTVLFAKEADYRRYTEATSSLSGTQVGHAGRGVLAFFAEGRSREDLARTLAHEITHLVNHRALARSLPPWLEEGLAADLGSAWVEDSSSVESGGAANDSLKVEVQGMESRLFLLGEYLKAEKLPPVTFLLSLDREGFHEPGAQSYAYAHSVALIRYFLDGDGGRHADGFRLFLKRIAVGTRADLLKCVEMSPEELESGFRAWLETEVVRGRERLEKRYRAAWENARG